MAKISERIERIKDTINAACARAGRDVNEITIIVVTKSAAIEAIKDVIRLGFTELGENRVQQLKKVSAQIGDSLKKQTNLIGI